MMVTTVKEYRKNRASNDEDSNCDHTVVIVIIKIDNKKLCYINKGGSVNGSNGSSDSSSSNDKGVNNDSDKNNIAISITIIYYRQDNEDSGYDNYFINIYDNEYSSGYDSNNSSGKHEINQQ